MKPSERLLQSSTLCTLYSASLGGQASRHLALMSINSRAGWSGEFLSAAAHCNYCAEARSPPHTAACKSGAPPAPSAAAPQGRVLAGTHPTWALALVCSCSPPHCKAALIDARPARSSLSSLHLRKQAGAPPSPLPPIAVDPSAAAAHQQQSSQAGACGGEDDGGDGDGRLRGQAAGPARFWSIHPVQGCDRCDAAGGRAILYSASATAAASTA